MATLTTYLRVLITQGLEEANPTPRDVIADGLAACERGEWSRARADLSAGLDEQPRHLEARLALARVGLGLKQLELAEAHARQAVADHPASAAALVLLGEVLQAADQAPAAEACYRKAIALAPKHTDAHLRLGILQFEGKRLLDALATLNHAVHLDSKAAVARFYLARVCMANRDYQRALVQLALVDKLQPNHPPVYFALAAIFEAIGDVRQTIVELSKLVDLGLGNANIFCRIGRAYLRLRAKDLALTAFEQAAAADPCCWAAHRQVAMLLEEHKRFTQAMDAYRMLLGDTPYDAEARQAITRVGKLLAVSVMEQNRAA